MLDIKESYPDFFAKIVSYFSHHSVEMITDAFDKASEKLDGMTRYDSTPLIGHSVHVAEIIITEIGLGRNSTISSLLHDVVRLGMMTAEEAGALYGSECTEILSALCNISDVSIKEEDEQADNFRDLIVSYATDPRVILIKLADRLEVMRSLGMFPPEKRLKKSWESLQLYSQIAHKLGLYTIKSELEDLSLSYLEPDIYHEIESKLKAGAAEREQFLRKFIKPVAEKLTASGIKFKIKSRTKTIYSIWNKMRRTGLPFEEIYDIQALRIIIDCPPEMEKQQCWMTYSIVTDFYTPNPERMRDWISIPKSNGYESLHGTVVTKEGQWVEVQIRSERMDEVAERGIAAHWRYKGVKQSGMGNEEWLAKLREMMDNRSQVVSDFEKRPSMGEIFAFTPTGDLRKLPEGATLLDFAFDIHTRLGSTCTGGRINGRNAPIKEVLKNGDIVEIYTSKTQVPKADWLNIVVTSKARGRIKAFLREQAAKTANLGREELERKLKNWKLPITLDDAVAVLSKRYKLKTGTEVYGSIADGRIDISSVKELLVRHIEGEDAPEIAKRTTHAASQHSDKRDDALIIDDSIKNMEYRLAGCCNPIRGDNIFGFVTVNKGIAIHRETCPNAVRLREKYEYRIIPARWRDSKESGAFQASIRIVTDNTSGILNRITETISTGLKINIRSMNIAPNNKGELSGIINIEVTGTQIVDMAIYHILKVKGVQRAYRVNN
jgi:GTP pyrophosphokinase